VSGSGISWAICKSAPRSRQTTTPAPDCSVFYRPDALPAALLTASKHWRQHWLQATRYNSLPLQLILLLCSFNGLFSRTTWVRRYQKGKSSLGLNEARDDRVWGWQWHQLDHMQTICTLLQTDNHTNTSSEKLENKLPSIKYQGQLVDD